MHLKIERPVGGQFRVAVKRLGTTDVMNMLGAHIYVTQLHEKIRPWI